MYRRLLRPLLFGLDAERAHRLTLTAGRLTGPALRRLHPPALSERLTQRVFDHSARGPVMLAAGADKDAQALPFWAALGLGGVEVGSVTARGGPGNPLPRAFRLPTDRALINRMGLPGADAATIARRLAAFDKPAGFLLGVNVSKTHDPTLLGADALEDFRASITQVAALGDYLALNVSCPNTAEGKTFEAPDALDALLKMTRRVLAERSFTRPLLVKLSPPGPDGLDRPFLRELLSVCTAHHIDGFVATNTAPDRHGLRSTRRQLDAIGPGGLSGAPLAPRAEKLTRFLFRETDGTLPILGVGGIDSAEVAYRRIRCGASLVQLYTGLVYEGPGLIQRIHGGLLARLDRDGLAHLSEAIGLDA